MIVTRTPHGLRLVTQAEHARLAAEILSLFRLPEVAAHPRRELLLRAVREHDNGWWEADSAPRLDASRTAVRDFRDFPAALRQEIWWRGVERFSAESPYLAALLAAHCLRLLRRVGDEASWAGFRSELSARQMELLAASGESLDTVAVDDPWIGLADSLSLAACTGRAIFVDQPGWRAEVGVAAEGSGPDETLLLGLEPFPFAGATSFGLAFRRLEERPFASETELGMALLAASWERARVRLQPL